MIFETVSVGPMQVNCYILASAENCPAIIIDPGDEEGKIRKVLAAHKLTPGLIINTHGHADHIGCDDKFGVSVYVHRDDAELLRDPRLNLSVFLNRSLSVASDIRCVKDNENIEMGRIQLKVIHVPGHTPGGISLLLKKPEGKVLFTGDSLFCRGIGRTDFPGASGKLLVKSIRDKLLTLDDDTAIYPGHGESSTIGEEKRENPFFS